MRLRVGDRFQGSLASTAQGGVLPRATNRRELSSRSIMSFETIGKAHIAWDSNIGQKADEGGTLGPIPRTGGGTPALSWSKAMAPTCCTWGSHSQQEDPRFSPTCGYTGGTEWPADNGGGGRRGLSRTSQPLPEENMGSGTGQTWVQILALPPPGSSLLGTWLNLFGPQVSHLQVRSYISVYLKKKIVECFLHIRML